MNFTEENQTPVEPVFISDDGTASDPSSTSSPSAPSPTSPKPKAGWVEWLRSLDTWWAVVLLLFGVTGVLGLPILWVSKSFNPLMKVVLSIAVTIYTCGLIGGVLGILVWAWQSITGSF